MASLTYATVEQVEAGFRELSNSEKAKCAVLISEAAIIIDSVASEADSDIKNIVTCRMVRRALNDGDQSIPMGATQGSVSALGYSQSWTLSSGATGELYLSKAEKTMLGVGNKIGASNPFANGGD